MSARSLFRVARSSPCGNMIGACCEASIPTFCSSTRFSAWLSRESKEAFSFHKTLDGYKPTPLITLPHLAQTLGVNSILLKDEGHRFGLKSFKSLGSSFALQKLIKDGTISSTSVVTTMTDGNHGRGLAWAARKMEIECVIYVPANVTGPRIKAIEDEGAKVIQIEGLYDDCIQHVKETATKKDWILIADSSWPGYTEICANIVAGYCTMFQELDDMLNPTHVIVQGGVGGLAAAAAHYTLMKRLRNMEYKSDTNLLDPKLIVVEPTRADCLWVSADAGRMIATKQDTNSFMQGLNCGTPSLISWPLLTEVTDLFIAIDDDWSKKAMRTLYFPQSQDPRVVSGESGAAGLGGLHALCTQDTLVEELGLNENSSILLINTEADTDPVIFKNVIGENPE